MKTFITTCLLSLVSVTSFAAQIELPAMLDKLSGGDDFVIIGDLQFDNFVYPADSVVQGDMPFASQIVVQAIPGDTGIRFTGPFLDLPGGAGNGASDATLGFTVTPTNGGAITGASLSGNPSLKGGATGIAEVVETFIGQDEAKLVIFDKSATVSLEDSVSFAEPLSSVTALKDILLLTQDTSNASTISVIDQTFELVPEPASATLCLLGLACVSFTRRRRR